MSEQDIPKTFDPADIESRWYAHWEGEGRFRPDRPDAEPWTLVNPPPNVTGNLHIGHALDNTLQDVLVRHARMTGKDAKWVVGTDHAGIATQMVVERQLNERQQKRTDFSREDFVAKVWEWKAESGGNITRQLRCLGCSMDWSNEQFTMDPHFVDAVTKVFVDLYNAGLIYRDKRLVNWDPALRTAISDLEVESREVQGHMWHFKYPLAGGETYTYVERDEDGNVTLEEERDYISIATTRPETMLGDGAVAVHPDDERYAPIVGKLCEIPVGPKEHRRLIPIITDDYPDPDFGSGAVKITGAHDENDYLVAERANIPMYRLMDEVAAMRTDGAPYAETSARAREIAMGADAGKGEIDAMNLVPDEYRGLDRYDARARVVGDIDAEGLMIKVEDKMIMQPFGDRGGVVIEPMLTDQWYVDAEKLAQAPLAAVRSGDIKIVPKSWEKTFFNWMENIQPWCVSRQLWWGHRIPAWYDEGGKAYVAITEEEAYAQYASRHPGEGRDPDHEEEGVQSSDLDPGLRRGDEQGRRVLTRDEDVLDTWFSSALWPFATQGWPDTDVKALGRYPNDVLVSGFDILFFWDARMMMMGMHLLGDVPFRDLYLHGLVRAADGQKMSKSKGNTVDPIGLIEQYGADALRFFMTAMESQGRDIKMDEGRIEGYRNFATKLWNAARFAQGYGIGASQTVAPPAATTAVNKWIVGEVIKTAQAVDLALADYRFDAYAAAVYHFAWSRFCDWYLELIKPVLQDEGHADAEETRIVAGWVLDQILVMLHPIMPFVTEELWHKLGGRPYDLILAKWVEADSRSIDVEAAKQVDTLIDLVTGIRGTRSELDVPAGAIMPLHYVGAPPTNEAAVKRLARVELTRADALPSSGGVRIAAGGVEYFLELAGVDIDAVKARYDKRIAATGKEIAGIEGRLKNPKFRERAPADVVAESEEKLEALRTERTRLTEALAQLG